jgi:hypothetical protein
VWRAENSFIRSARCRTSFSTSCDLSKPSASKEEYTMKSLTRLFVTAIAAFATFYFLSFSLLLSPLGHLKPLVSLVCAAGVASTLGNTRLLYLQDWAAASFLARSSWEGLDSQLASLGHSFCILRRTRGLCLAFYLPGRWAFWLEPRAGPSTGGCVVNGKGSACPPERRLTKHDSPKRFAPAEDLRDFWRPSRKTPQISRSSSRSLYAG